MRGRDWERRAACASVDPDLFFPEGFEERVWKVPLAKAVCARCPVLAECRALCDRLERGRELARIFGLWAEETPRERIARRRGGEGYREFRHALG
jgi:WhiB family redox-sensing transcriptional regulator